MAILFLYIGALLAALGLFIIGSQLKARRGSVRVHGKVVGFSTQDEKSSNGLNYRTVVEYRGLDYQQRYAESPISSSAPLNLINEEIPVYLTPGEFDVANLQSSFSFFIGAVLFAMGAAAIAVFSATFTLDLFSILGALFVTGAIAQSIWKVRRKTSIPWGEWRERAKTAGKARVFLASQKDEILWCHPDTVTVALKRRQRSTRSSIPIGLAVGIGALLLTEQLFESTHTFVTSALRAPGQVVELRHRFDTDGSMYTPVVEFTHPESGEVTRFKHSVSSSHPSYRVGDTVTVLVDPAGKSKAKIDTGLWLYLFPAISGVVGVLFLSVGFRGIFALRRSQRLGSAQTPLPRRPSRSA